MKWKYALKEFRKELLLNLIVIMQAAVIYVTIIAAVTSVVTRYQYYAPFADLFDSPGCAMLVDESMCDAPKMLTAQGIADILEGSPTAYGIYTLMGAVPENGRLIVYDDALWEAFHPELIAGKAVTFSADETAKVLISKGSGRKVGGQIGCQYVYAEEPIMNTLEITGVFEDTAQVLYFNANAVQRRDFRMLFMPFYELQEEYRQSTGTDGYPVFYLMSASEAKKLCRDGEFVVSGLTLLSYPAPVDAETENENMIRLSGYGMMLSVDNSMIKKNSTSYIYEQLYTLLPVLIGTFILLIISIFSVNAVSVTKQLRTYAVYRCCGLSWFACCLITVEKVLLNTAVSLLLCFAFLYFKPQVPVLDGMLIKMGVTQVLFVICIVLVNVTVSFCISTAMLQRCTPNTLLRSE